MLKTLRRNFTERTTWKTWRQII